jgi:hypothetical protein
MPIIFIPYESVCNKALVIILLFNSFDFNVIIFIREMEEILKCQRKLSQI